MVPGQAISRGRGVRRERRPPHCCRGAPPRGLPILPPNSVALWTGYRLGVLDAIAPETFAGLLDREVNGLLSIAKGGYIAGRAGLTTTEALDQLYRERHEAAARRTGMGLIPARSAGTGQLRPSVPTRPQEAQGRGRGE